VKKVPTLYIGELAAGICENDAGNKYIELRPVAHCEDEEYQHGLVIDDIEAEALYCWLRGALGIREETGQ
jgi:hypothetical protein